MLEGLIQPLKVKGLPLTSAGFGSDFKIAELEDLWPAGARQTERNRAGQHVTAPKKASCSPSPPSSQWEMDAAAGTFVLLPKSATNLLIPTNSGDNFKWSDLLQKTRSTHSQS